MNQRDLELLSSYLDGQLKPSDSARLERRLSTDTDLRAVLDDLRSARGLLRKLPMRKAPRNFTLTPKMVGKNPPLPRTYPAFKFVTVLTTLLLFFTFGVNFMAVQMSAPAGSAFGMGGGGAPEIMQAAPATEAPMEEPASESVLEPAPTPTLAVELAVPEPTTLPPSAEDSARTAETPMQKNDAATGGVEGQDQSEADTFVQSEAARPVSPGWQIVLAGVALLGVLVMFLMQKLAAERWRGK